MGTEHFAINAIEWYNTYYMKKRMHLILVMIATLCCGCAERSITEPSFSSNDEYIIFGGGVAHRGIYRINKDGSNLKQIVIGASGCQDMAPALSPDDKKLVFSRRTKGGFEHLYLVDLASSKIIQLTDGDIYDRSPVFSPDGKKIYFLRYAQVPHVYPSTYSVYSIDIDSSSLEKITKDVNAYLERISISPDGKTIAVGCRDQAVNLINLDGSGDRTMEFKDTSQEFCIQPGYSPDGNSIVFIGRVMQGSNYSACNIYVMDLKLREPKEIATIYDHYVEWPSFSHNGNEITVCSGPPYATNKLWIMSRNGSDIRRVNINFRNKVK